MGSYLFNLPLNEKTSRITSICLDFFQQLLATPGGIAMLEKSRFCSRALVLLAEMHERADSVSTRDNTLSFLA